MPIFNPSALYQQALINELMKAGRIEQQYMDMGMEKPADPMGRPFPDINAVMPQHVPPSVPGISPAWDMRQEEISYRIPGLQR